MHVPKVFDRFGMGAARGGGAGDGQSFMPEDYLQRKAELRGNIISVVLLGMVLTGVVGAFFVTNQAWSAVRRQQGVINAEYAEQTKKIEQLKKLEAQRAEMLDKAEVTAALIERVPRSILLAETINRMPDRLTLVEVELKSRRLPEPPPTPGSAGKAGAPGKPGAPGARPATAGKPAGGVGGKGAETARPRPPRMEYTLTLTGLSSTDEAVADFQSALKQCDLLHRVDLISSIAETVDDVTLRKFRLEAQIRPDADARKIAPLQVPREKASQMLTSPKGVPAAPAPGAGGADKPALTGAEAFKAE